MHFSIISAVPELLDSSLSHSIMQRAQKAGLLSLDIIQLRDYGQGNYNQIDDYQYGGGAGMVLMPEPLARCIEDIAARDRPIDEIIYLTPDGQRYDQKIANELSLLNHIILLCGHYKGIDERIRQKYVTREISIGDFVLSGGELPAAILVDSITRLIPGVIGDESSALTDSFQDELLAPPVYTRPAEFQGMKVPEVLLSGHTARIEEWRDREALKRTKLRRPDLYNAWKS